MCRAFMSPVADAYGKPGLAPAAHRLAMCGLAAAASATAFTNSLSSPSSPSPPLVIEVDGWEAGQQGYTRTLQVLRHIKEVLAEATPQVCMFMVGWGCLADLV